MLVSLLWMASIWKLARERSIMIWLQAFCFWECLPSNLCLHGVHENMVPTVPLRLGASNIGRIYSPLWNSPLIMEYKGNLEVEESTSRICNGGFCIDIQLAFVFKQGDWALKRITVLQIIDTDNYNTTCKCTKSLADAQTNIRAKGT